MDTTTSRYSDDEDERGPFRPSLRKITAAAHPFSIPWSTEIRPLMAGLDSSRLFNAEGPWTPSCPFDLAQARMTTVLSDTLGGVDSYKDNLSTMAGQSNEHLSAQLGVGVGPSFLRATVTGQYDRNVTTTESAIRASRNSSCRVGRIILTETPTFSAAAKQMLKSKDGATHFRKAYGDFYIWGYELGADAGATLSASTETMTSRHTLSLTLTVRVLFWEETTPPVTKTWEEASATSTLDLCGYSTLEAKSEQTAFKGSSAEEQQQLQRQAKAYLGQIASLHANVRGRLAEVGLKDGEKLPFSACSTICLSGLVVQLCLAPFARLDEYVRCTT